MRKLERTAFYRIFNHKWAVVNEKIKTVEGYIEIVNGRYEVKDIYEDTLAVFDSLQEAKDYILE